MLKHKRIYLKHFGYGEQDVILCEICKSPASEIHHIIYRSKGVNNNISNLMAVCRECHTKIHDKEVYDRSYLQMIHNKFTKANGR